MNYKLAKKLQDAGFEGGLDGLWINKQGGISNAPDGIDDAYIPTLAELIEACGQQFCELCQTSDFRGFVARGDSGWYDNLPSYNLTDGWGKTADEAVANLWLTLNKK